MDLTNIDFHTSFWRDYVTFICGFISVLIAIPIKAIAKKTALKRVMSTLEKDELLVYEPEQIPFIAYLTSFGYGTFIYYIIILRLCPTIDHIGYLTPSTAIFWGVIFGPIGLICVLYFLSINIFLTNKRWIISYGLLLENDFLSSKERSYYFKDIIKYEEKKFILGPALIIEFSNGFLSIRCFKNYSKLKKIFIELAEQNKESRNMCQN